MRSSAHLVWESHLTAIVCLANDEGMMMDNQFRKVEQYSPKSSPRGARSPVVSRQDSSGTLKTTILLGKNPSIVPSGPFYLMKEPPGMFSIFLFVFIKDCELKTCFETFLSLPIHFINRNKNRSASFSILSAVWTS